jgi:hypothetical protein
VNSGRRSAAASARELISRRKAPDPSLSEFCSRADETFSLLQMNSGAFFMSIIALHMRMEPGFMNIGAWIMNIRAIHMKIAALFM